MTLDKVAGRGRGFHCDWGPFPEKPFSLSEAAGLSGSESRAVVSLGSVQGAVCTLGAPRQGSAVWPCVMAGGQSGWADWVMTLRGEGWAPVAKAGLRG